jgi:hypothetical protein
VRPREAEASFQMHARGVLALPVGTHAQVSRVGLRIAERTMFMVPPYAVRAGTPGASARGADLQGQHESSVREGVSLRFWQPPAHALKSQVVCWDER